MDPIRHAHKHCELQHLVLPPVDRQELTVVGGGLSSLEFASQLLHSSGPLWDGERERLLKISSLPKRGVDSVCMLSAGPSVAYEGARGPFSRFLTLSGSDRIERRAQMARIRANIKAGFSERGFSYCEGSTVTSVAKTTSGAYRLQVHGAYGGKVVETERLALALGHSLRQIPDTLKEFVIQGAGDLCRRLETAQNEDVSDAGCLARTLGRYSAASNGTLRIALVGVGMSFIEVVKILENLLERPKSTHGKYTISGSDTPVELVVYSPRLSAAGGSWQELCYAVEKGLQELPPIQDGDSLQKAEAESREYKASAVARIRKFGEAGQLLIAPRRFDWESVEVRDNKVLAQSNYSGPDEISCIIDCAPFVEGLTAQQAEIVKNVEDVELVKLTTTEWFAKCRPIARQRLALLGAAFTPRKKWNETTWKGQATEALIGFYPPEY